MTDDIRRHPDGAIDFDFYRARSLAQRCHAQRGNHTLSLVGAGAAIMIAAVGFAAVVPAASTLGHRLAQVFPGLPLTR